MASMASSRAGCRWTSPAVAPARDSVVAAQSRRFSLFSSTSGAGVFGVPCRTSKKLVRAKLLVAREQIFPHSNGFSSSLARCALIDNSQPNAAGGSEVCHDLPTAIWERTGIVFGKIKQFAAIVLVASSFQLFCNEAVLALEFGTNNSEQGTVNAASTNVSSGEFSQQFGAPLSVDINSSTEVTSLPSDVTTDSSSQVRSVSSSLDTGEGLPSSQPSAEIGRPAELSNPECSTSSMAVLEEEAGRSSEPVTNESVVEEAWEVVNENFLDARRHSWSAEDWLRQKEDVLKRPIRSRMAAYGAIRSMLATLNDPYTRFLTPDQFLQLSKYDVTGVGLNIGEIEVNGTTSLRVLGIVLGSPAQTMGVRQGDELIAVNGTAVRGMSAFEAASLIQGPKGTPVTIQIRHGPCEEVQNLTVPREQDVRTPVFYRLERTQNPRQLMGYIRLKEFNALAKRDLVTAMKRLQDAGATSFLLDLQDNPGGLVQAGIEIARLFLDGGETVIQTVGRDPTIFKNIMASGVALTKAPLMVLVNDRTASASEIVAAALHDNCRAVLVGNRTFGKGLIQSVYELSDGSGIILTVGKYVTPGHIDIDGNGIEPDFRNPPGLSEAMEKLGACELKLKSVSSISTQTS